VGIDAVDIGGGSLVQAHYEQTDSRLLYEGSWSNSTGADHSAGSYKFTSSVGSAVNIAFNGTSFDWYTVKGPIYGIARVSVDGGAPLTVDLYSTGLQYQSKVWSISGLPSTAHTVRIEWTGTKNASASNTYVGIDAADVVGGALTQATSPVTRFDQSAAGITFGAAWSPQPSADLYGGSYMFTGSAGATSTIKFQGKRFDWITAVGPMYGIATVSIDGAAPVQVDLYATALAYKQKAWSVTTLTDTAHTAVITVTGTKNSSASNVYVGVDAVDLALGKALIP